MRQVTTYIVEDSPIILENLVDTLQELSPVRVVGSAPDEESAVAWLTNAGRACDLIIVDIYLRSGSGLGVLKSLSQAGIQGEWVVLSNYATPEMRQKCSALGASRVFDKSCELDELIAYCSELGGSELGGQSAMAA
jgi:DNA-binding NarL/FixJ family response regulator